MSDEETLPAKVLPALPQIPNTDVAPDADFSTVKATDVLSMNAYLKAVGVSLAYCTSVKDVCAAALTASKLIQLRRRLLCYPDAYKGSSESEAFVLPID